MILMLTGQHHAGKSTFASKLADRLLKQYRHVIVIDGDQLRLWTYNTDYTDKGRELNQARAAVIAACLDNEDTVIIIAVIFPRRELRLRIERKLGARTVHLWTNRLPSVAAYVTEYQSPSIDDVLASICTDRDDESYWLAMDAVERYCIANSVSRGFTASEEAL
jgi:adenylate kinase family enzyme